MTSIVRADNISTVAGTGTVTVQAGNTLDTSAGLVTPAGHVLQVVSAQYDTENLVSTSTLTDYMTLDITPSSTSSKIYVCHNLHYTGFGSVRIQRRPSGGSTVAVMNPGTDYGFYVGIPTYLPSGTDPASSGFRLTGSFHLVDEPATTSTITYACQVQCHQPGNYHFELNPNGIYSTSGPNQAATQLILMEIAG